MVAIKSRYMLALFYRDCYYIRSHLLLTRFSLATSCSRSTPHVQGGIDMHIPGLM